jgi:hypothetical protein
VRVGEVEEFEKLEESVDGMVTGQQKVIEQGHINGGSGKKCLADRSTSARDAVR